MVGVGVRARLEYTYINRGVHKVRIWVLWLV